MKEYNYRIEIIGKDGVIYRVWEDTFASDEDAIAEAKAQTGKDETCQVMRIIY